MSDKPTYEELEQRVKELAKKLEECKRSRETVGVNIEKSEPNSKPKTSGIDTIQVSGINLEWRTNQGTCTFEDLPVVMMWIDTTLAGLMSGVQAMVGTKRFGLALQSEGRKSVEADWQVISQFSDFRKGFKAIANIAAVAGWGDWRLISYDEHNKECRFRVRDSWEGLYQKALGVCWGSGMLAGKMAGYCSRLFGENCWTDQTAFIANGDEFDEFVVKPSERSLEQETENLLTTGEATRADMAVALQKLRREVSERKRAEETLRESEEKYRLLVQNANDAIFIAQDEVVRFPNPKSIEMTGYTADELSAIPFINLVHPEDRELVGERYKRRLKGEELPATYSFRILNKAGEVLWVQLNTVLITWDERPATLNFLRDITPQKQMETQLQRAQKMEAIGTLAGGIAHDFNNILSAVMGYTEIALEDIKQDTLLYNNLQEVLKAGERAKELVRQILTFSRQTEQERKPVQVKLLAKEALKLLRASLPTSIEIRHEIQNDSLVSADPTQIHQILMNLCTNAGYAMRENGGVLTVKLENVELDANFMDGDPEAKPGSFIKLTVSDTGHGMSQEVLERIFDPFFTTKKPGEGTGMGLAVVHGIVRSYGGAITANSEPGRGATFEVYLPGIKRRLEPQTRTEEPIPTGSERILFVDDEPVLADMGKQLLESLGYEVVTRTSSIEALELFRAQPDKFDLVITDMTMPNMTGDDLAREMMRIEPVIPIILCTGFSEKIDEQKAEGMGLRAFVSKPILKRELAEAVRRILDT